MLRRKRQYEMDMCSGSLAGKLLLFALPLLASTILQLLFNAADVIVVGRYAAQPAQALAAVGSNNALINLTINLFTGISIGANVVDCLVEYDNYGLCQPCLAESWTRSEDGLTWTFKVREGVRWQQYDGSFYGDEYVKAEDWVTSAKWILDPVNTARTADLLFDIVGAEDYYLALEAGQTADWETVGIKAISEYEIQYTLTFTLD